MTMSNLVRDVMYTRPEEAEELSIEALSMRRQILGDDHPDVAWSMYNLAYVLLERGKTRDAEDSLKKAFAMRGPNLPDGHPVVSSSFLLLGRILMARGLNEEARGALEKCLELRLATLPGDHWLVATTRSFLGQCLIRLGHSAAGEKLLRDSYYGLVDKLGQNHEQTRQAEERLRNAL
jgi:tetratricopeptide (TPR) repeat protein